MSTSITDETILLREAIEQVLREAARPMTSVQIHEAAAVRELGVSVKRVSHALRELWMLRRKPFPLGRVDAPTVRPKWEYYHMDVCNPLAYRTRKPVEVNDVNSEPQVQEPEFQFNALELGENELTPPAAQVQVPPGVKNITLSVGGVTIRIELNA